MEKKNDFFELSNAATYVYMTGEKVRMFFDMELREEIQRSALEKAAELTLKRFPFFAVRLAESDEGDRYILRKNENSLPVTEKNGFVSVFSDEANAYLFTVSYFGKHLFSEFFHGLSDGQGMMTFLAALVKAYFELRENRRFVCAGVKNIWDEPDEAEWKDPMDCLRKTETEFKLKKQESFRFPDEKIDDGSVRLYRFSVPENALIEYAKKYEGGVSGAIALTLARAIDISEPENELPLRIACPMDIRKMLGCPETMRNCTKSSAYTHSKELRSLSHEKQLSVLKGQMMLQASEEYQLPRCIKDKTELAELNACPTIEAKKAHFTAITLKSDPIVSYLGKFDMGELNDRIENVSVYGKVSGKAGMQSVCLCFKGRCYINCSYNLKSESYIKLFANEMGDFSQTCSPVMRVDYDEPAKMSMLYDTIRENGSAMNILLYSPCKKKVKYAIVAVHGFAGHKESSAITKLAERLFEQEPESAVLSFDLPGHGDDKEPLSVEKCGKYIQAAEQYMRKRYPDAELILQGTSFGGYLSFKYAYEHPESFDKYILRCPAVNMGNTLRKKILTAEDIKTLREGGTAEKGFDMKVTLRQSFLDSLDKFKVIEKSYTDMADKMLVVQGLCDELVDCDEVKDFAAKNGLKLVLSEGADHRFLFGGTMESTIKDVVRFILGKKGEGISDATQK